VLAVIDDDPTGAQDDADVPVVEYARDGAFSYRTARLIDCAQVNFASGRGRASAFVPGPARFGVPIECTEFKFEEDVDGNRGWLDD
jgi:hypothetical protein